MGDSALLALSQLELRLKLARDQFSFATRTVKQSGSTVAGLSKAVFDSVILGDDGEIGNLLVLGDANIQEGLLVGGFTQLAHISAKSLGAESSLCNTATVGQLSASSLDANTQADSTKIDQLLAPGVAELGQVLVEEAAFGNASTTQVLAATAQADSVSSVSAVANALVGEALTAEQIQGHLWATEVQAVSAACASASGGGWASQRLGADAADILNASISTLVVGHIEGGLTSVYYSHSGSVPFQRSGSSLPALALTFATRNPCRVDIRLLLGQIEVHIASFLVVFDTDPVVRQITSQFEFELLWDGAGLFVIPQTSHLADGQFYQLQFGVAGEVDVTSFVTTSASGSPVHMPLVVGPELLVPDLAPQQIQPGSIYSQEGAENVGVNGGLLVRSIPQGEVIVLDVWLVGGPSSRLTILFTAQPFVLGAGQFVCTYNVGVGNYDLHVSSPESSPHILFWGIKSLSEMSVVAAGPSVFPSVLVPSPLVTVDEVSAIIQQKLDLEANVAAITHSYIEASANVANIEEAAAGNLTSQTGTFEILTVGGNALLFSLAEEEALSEGIRASLDLLEFDLLEVSAVVADPSFENLDVQDTQAISALVLELRSDLLVARSLEVSMLEVDEVDSLGKVLGDLNLGQLLAGALVQAALANVGRLFSEMANVDEPNETYDLLEANTAVTNLLEANLDALVILAPGPVATASHLEAAFLPAQTSFANIELVRAGTLAYQSNLGELGNSSLIAGNSSFQSLLVANLPVTLISDLQSAIVDFRAAVEDVQDLQLANLANVPQVSVDAVDANIELLGANIDLLDIEIANTVLGLENNVALVETLLQMADANLSQAVGQMDANFSVLDQADSQLRGWIFANTSPADIFDLDANISNLIDFVQSILDSLGSGLGAREAALLADADSVSAQATGVEAAAGLLLASNTGELLSQVASLGTSANEDLGALALGIESFQASLLEVTGDFEAFRADTEQNVLTPLADAETSLEANDVLTDVRLLLQEAQVADLQANFEALYSNTAVEFAQLQEELLANLGMEYDSLSAYLAANVALLQLELQATLDSANQVLLSGSNLDSDARFQVQELSEEIYAYLASNASVAEGWMSANRESFLQEFHGYVSANASLLAETVVAEFEALANDVFEASNLDTVQVLLQANVAALELGAQNARASADGAVGAALQLGLDIEQALTSERVLSASDISIFTVETGLWIQSNRSELGLQVSHLIEANLLMVAGYIRANLDQLASDLAADLKSNIDAVAGWVQANADAQLLAVQPVSVTAGQALSDIDDLEVEFPFLQVPLLEDSLEAALDIAMADLSVQIQANVAALRESIDTSLEGVLSEQQTNVAFLVAGQVDLVQANIGEVMVGAIEAAQVVAGNATVESISGDVAVLENVDSGEGTLSISSLTVSSLQLSDAVLPGVPGLVAGLTRYAFPPDDLLRTGGTMTGDLTVPSVSSGSLSIPSFPDVPGSLTEAVGRLTSTGDTMTGDLTVPALSISGTGSFVIPSHNVGSALDDRLLRSGGTVTSLAASDVDASSVSLGGTDLEAELDGKIGASIQSYVSPDVSAQTVILTGEASANTAIFSLSSATLTAGTVDANSVSLGADLGNDLLQAFQGMDQGGSGQVRYEFDGSLQDSGLSANLTLAAGGITYGSVPVKHIILGSESSLFAPLAISSVGPGYMALAVWLFLPSEGSNVIRISDSFDLVVRCTGASLLVEDLAGNGLAFDYPKEKWFHLVLRASESDRQVWFDGNLQTGSQTGSGPQPALLSVASLHLGDDTLVAGTVAAGVRIGRLSLFISSLENPYLLFAFDDDPSKSFLFSSQSMLGQKLYDATQGFDYLRFSDKTLKNDIDFSPASFQVPNLTVSFWIRISSYSEQEGVPLIMIRDASSRPIFELLKEGDLLRPFSINQPQPSVVMNNNTAFLHFAYVVSTINGYSHHVTYIDGTQAPYLDGTQSGPGDLSSVTFTGPFETQFGRGYADPPLSYIFNGTEPTSYITLGSNIPAGRTNFTFYYRGEYPSNGTIFVIGGETNFRGGFRIEYKNGVYELSFWGDIYGERLENVVLNVPNEVRTAVADLLCTFDLKRKELKVYVNGTLTHIESTPETSGWEGFISPDLYFRQSPDSTTEIVAFWPYVYDPSRATEDAKINAGQSPPVVTIDTDVSRFRVYSRALTAGEVGIDRLSSSPLFSVAAQPLGNQELLNLRYSNSIQSYTFQADVVYSGWTVDSVTKTVLSGGAVRAQDSEHKYILLPNSTSAKVNAVFDLQPTLDHTISGFFLIPQALPNGFYTLFRFGTEGAGLLDRSSLVYDGLVKWYGGAIGSLPDVQFSTNPPVGQWFHLVLEVSGTSVRLFFNGQLQLGAQSGSTSGLSVEANLEFGATVNGGQSIPGLQVADFRVFWNQSLPESAYELLRLRRFGQTFETSDLQALRISAQKVNATNVISQAAPQDRSEKLLRIDRKNLRLTKGSFPGKASAHIRGDSLRDVTGNGFDLELLEGSVSFEEEDGVKYWTSSDTNPLRLVSKLNFPDNGTFPHVISVLVYFTGTETAGFDNGWSLVEVGDPDLVDPRRRSSLLINSNGGESSITVLASNTSFIEKRFPRPTGATTGKWHQIVAYIDQASNEVDVYVDGALLPDGYTRGPSGSVAFPNGFQKLIIGRENNSGSVRYADIKVFWNTTFSELQLVDNPRHNPRPMYARAISNRITGIRSQQYARDASFMYYFPFYGESGNEMLDSTTTLAPVNASSAISTTRAGIVGAYTLQRTQYNVPITSPGSHEMMAVFDWYSTASGSSSLWGVIEFGFKVGHQSSRLKVDIGTGPVWEFAEPAINQWVNIAVAVKYIGSLGWEVVLAYDGMLQIPVVFGSHLLAEKINVPNPLQVFVGVGENNEITNSTFKNLSLYRSPDPPPNGSIHPLLAQGLVKSSPLQSSHLILGGLDLNAKLTNLQGRILSLEP